MSNAIDSLNYGNNVYTFTLPYGSCSTEAATAAKVVTVPNFSLETGARIAVKFTVTNTASSPTLNVNGNGAKAIYYKGAAITAGYLAANKTYEFVYNGTQWDLIGDVDTNTNTDTKNTAGSTNSSSKLFLIGATSQAANPQTYSHDTAYVGTDGCLYSGSAKVLTSVPSHASTATTYGIGTGSNYGHVKLSDSTSSTSAASSGIAATPAAVKAAYDLATSANSNANNRISSTTSSIELNNTGSLKSYGGFIDFHYYNSDGKPTNSSGTVVSSTPDYTSRIIEDSAGTISVNGVKMKSGTVTGSLSGNATSATSATKATQDASGNVITSTYMTKVNPTGSGNVSLGRTSGSTVGDSSVVIGTSSQATAANSIAIGSSSSATGANSIAIGTGITASGVKSVAFGDHNTASGEYATAFGCWTNAPGTAAVSFGNGTNANGWGAMASGIVTNAKGLGQHVFGSYNIPDSNTISEYYDTSDHLIIVGNGDVLSDDGVQSNAHTLDWSGNAWFAGDVYVGSTSGTNKDSGSKKLATVDDFFGITTSGTGAAYTATVDGITSLDVGVSFIMVPHVVSTSTAPTLNVNGLGAKTIRRMVSNSTASTVAGYNTSWLGKSMPVRVTYNGTYWIAELTKPSAADISGTLAIANGGTGATTAANALTNLGALPKAGGTMTGNLVMSGKEIKQTGGIWMNNSTGLYSFAPDSTSEGYWLIGMNASNVIGIGGSYGAEGEYEGPLIKLNSGAYSHYIPSVAGEIPVWNLLWENSSPSSNFAAQSITVNDLSKYNMFMLLSNVSNATDWKNEKTPPSFVYSPDGSTVCGQSCTVYTSTSNMRYRSWYVTPSENTVYFYNAWVGGSSGNTASCIPVYLFGIKI